LCRSGGSAVVGVDAVGGPTDGDFTDECDVRVSARRRPNGLDAVVAGVVSNVLGEVGDQVGSLGQVLPPVGVVTIGSQSRRGWFVGDVGYDLVGSAVQRRYPLGSEDLLGGSMQGVGVALNGLAEPGPRGR
jgi:hypothetical protein